MARKAIRVDKDDKKVNFPEFSIDDPMIYMLFEETKAADYEETFNSMLHIGALAMLNSDIHHLIDTSEREIYPRLERFKLMYDRRKARFEETSMAKGDEAEVDIVDLLSEFAKGNGWSDEVEQSGKIKGNLEGNKTGDVLATIELHPRDGGELDHTTVALEVKFDKSMPFGDPSDFSVETGKPWDKGFKASDKKTAWSQLLETKANRDSPFSIIVFDKRLISSSVSKAVEEVSYIPGIPGFVVTIDSQSGDYTNLKLVYRIARDMAIHHSRGDLDVDAQVIEMIAKRMLHYLGDAKKVSAKVRSHANSTAKMNQEVQKLLNHAVQHAEYTEDFLRRYLTTKKLTPVDFAEFYFAHPVAESLRESSDSEAEFAKELNE